MQKATSPFLSLPPELRDMIYEYLLAVNIGLRGKGEWKPKPLHDDFNYSIHHSDTTDHFSKICPAESASAGLFCTNRQINEELCAKVSKINAAGWGVTSVLDVVASLGEIHPDWQALPAPTKHIQTVRVHLQPDMFDIPPMMVAGRLSDTGASLLQLLSRYMTYGPSFRSTKSAITATPPIICHEDLIIHLYEQEWCHAGSICDPDFHLSTVCRVLAESGLLYGKFRNVRIVSEYKYTHFDEGLGDHPNLEIEDIEVEARPSAVVEETRGKWAAHGWMMAEGAKLTK